MKSKLFLTVLLLAVITTIGISQEKQSQPLKTNEELQAELVRIYKRPIYTQSLVGIKGIYVLIENLDENTLSTGLTKEQLQTDVELKLRLAGIKVNSEEERLASLDMAYIYVTFNTGSDKVDPMVVYTASVRLNQQVKLVRSPYTTVRGVTWETEEVGEYHKNNFPEVARERVQACMDLFLNSYLTANPKR